RPNSLALRLFDDLLSPLPDLDVLGRRKGLVTFPLAGFLLELLLVFLPLDLGFLSLITLLHYI
ncbi:hypothetical protein, partial [Psychrobacter sp.]|uniref:hypothetical protein n=1 Tax=Psychrobacter sp. TaxID=56811 RepID=UPI003F9EADDE